MFEVSELSKSQREILQLLTEHPEIAISWSGPLENRAGFTVWQHGWPRLGFGTFKALLRRGLIIPIAKRQERKGWNPMRYYRPTASPEWVKG
jgi:hypothetical protein